MVQIRNNILVSFKQILILIVIPICYTASPLNMSIEEKIEADNRSVYVGNVDYGATAEELEQHFHGCGSINRYCINWILGADSSPNKLLYDDAKLFKWTDLFLQVRLLHVGDDNTLGSIMAHCLILHERNIPHYKT